MMHPESGGKDGWVGLAESPAWEGDTEKDLRRGIVVPASASEETKVSLQSQNYKAPVKVGILFAVFSFSTTEVTAAASSLLTWVCSNRCSFPAMSKGGSSHSICIKQTAVLLSGVVCNLSWLVVFPTTIPTERRIGVVHKLLLRNPRFALQLTVGFDEISGGAYGILMNLCLRISLLNRLKKSFCFRETSMLAEYQLHIYLR